MKRIYLTVAIGIILFSVTSCKQHFRRPNFLFILSDDHTSTAISAYGKSLIQTPNIDRIAKDGILFTNCFDVVSLCTPSRAAILTGKYSAVNGVYKIGNVFDGSQETFPKILQSAGYQTAIFGKWHLTSQPTGFDCYNVVKGLGRYYDSPFKSSNEKWVKGRGKNIIPGYLTDVLTDISINWLEKRDKNKPFCIMVNHVAPHTPHIYPEKYGSILRGINIPEPENFDDDFKGKNSCVENDSCEFSKLQYILPGHFVEPIPKELKIGTEEYKKWSYQTIIKSYHRMVTSLDDNIGRLLDYLDSSGLSKNTIVIYSSDNGFFLGDHGLFNKQWMYEESLRIPLIIRLPGDKYKDKVINDLVSELDFASTILDYAGIKIPASFQGLSLRPVINGSQKEPLREAHFYHYFNQFEVPEHYGIRTEKYKLINFICHDSLQWEFYDLKKDGKEMNNQYNNPVYKNIVDSLKQELFSLKRRFEEGEDSKQIIK